MKVYLSEEAKAELAIKLQARKELNYEPQIKTTASRFLSEVYLIYAPATELIGLPEKLRSNAVISNVLETYDWSNSVILRCTVCGYEFTRTIKELFEDFNRYIAVDERHLKFDMRANSVLTEADGLEYNSLCSNCIDCYHKKVADGSYDRWSWVGRSGFYSDDLPDFLTTQKSSISPNKNGYKDLFKQETDTGYIDITELLNKRATVTIETPEYRKRYYHTALLFSRLAAAIDGVFKVHLLEGSVLVYAIWLYRSQMVLFYSQFKTILKYSIRTPDTLEKIITEHKLFGAKYIYVPSGYDYFIFNTPDTLRDKILRISQEEFEHDVKLMDQHTKFNMYSGNKLTPVERAGRDIAAEKKKRQLLISKVKRMEGRDDS